MLMNCAAICEGTRNNYVTNYYGMYKLLTATVQKTSISGNTLKRNSRLFGQNPNRLLLKNCGTDKKINEMEHLRVQPEKHNILKVFIFENNIRFVRLIEPM